MMAMFGLNRWTNHTMTNTSGSAHYVRMKTKMTSAVQTVVAKGNRNPGYETWNYFTHKPKLLDINLVLHITPHEYGFRSTRQCWRFCFSFWIFDFMESFISLVFFSLLQMETHCFQENVAQVQTEGVTVNLSAAFHGEPVSSCTAVFTAALYNVWHKQYD